VPKQFAKQGRKETGWFTGNLNPLGLFSWWFTVKPTGNRKKPVNRRKSPGE